MRKENSIRKKIIGIICGMIVFVSIALGLISYKAYYDAHIQFYYDKALGIVKLLASEVDSERIDYYVQTGDKDSEYMRMQEYFNNVKTNTSDLNYLYLFVNKLAMFQ